MIRKVPCTEVKVSVFKVLRWRHYTEGLTDSVAPEPDGSSPHSQKLSNGPYPKPGESTPHSRSQSP
jgi:hypothetical protein